MQTMRFGLPGRGAQWSRLLGIGLGIAFLVVLQPRGDLWTTGPIARAQKNDASYEDEFEKGRDLLRRHQYEEALKSFKRANEMREKKSPECFFWMAQAYQGLQAYKNVAESCEKAIELAGNDIQLRVDAYNLEGLALQSQSEGKDQKKLQEAEAVFRQGLALSPDLPMLHYNLGLVLMQQSRDPEGVIELKKYLELRPSEGNAEAARKLIENPRRAREAYAPDFSITTADGEYIALDDLRGKVVLLDFWGTWCPPCVSSVPSLRNLHRRYEKEPSFVMISISVNDEEDRWRAFTTRNQMVWPQYLDSEHKIQRAFGVHLFPTYIVIDHEGIVRFRSSGSSWERTADLEDAIHKRVKIVAKTSPSD
jgi:tetratricopeptide (TPR) repeat protein